MYIKVCPTLLKINVISSLLLRTASSGSIKLLSQPLTYASSDKLQRQKVSNVIEEFSEDLKHVSGKCMDIGCGPGDITKDYILPAINPNAVVIGTDISRNMIEYAKKKYSVKDRLDFEVFNIQTKKLPKMYVSEFDYIFSFHTLHWCTDIRQAFQNTFSMLRPNGTMLILFVASHNIFKILEELEQDSRFAPYIEDVNKYIWPFQNSKNPRKELKELLQNLGFTVTHCSLREEYYIDENPKQFFSSILSFLEFIDDMPCNRKEEFKNEFALKFMDVQISYKRKTDNKQVTIDTYEALLATAQKYVP